MKQHFRWLRATIVFTVFCMFLTSCGGQSTASQTDSASAASSENSGDTSDGTLTLPFGNGTTDTLSISCLEGWYSAVSMNDNLAVWQEVEKRTGVKIEWEAISDYDTSILPRIASNSELPDIMLVPPAWSSSGVYKIAQEGLIIPLDSLISENAPDIQQVLSDDPALKALLTAPDGIIYTIADTPKYVNDLVFQNTLFVRQDWLNKVGKEVPQTIEDWHDVLSAFKNDDPNGNGQADEIAFSGNAVLERLSVFESAFGIPSGSGAWWYDENGEVYCVYATENYKAYLTEMNKWYSEGLVDQTLNRDESNLQSLVSTNVVGVFTTLSERQNQYDNLLSTAGVSGGEHTLVSPPADSSGNLQIVKRSPTWNHYGITKYCANPELAIKWIDYVWGTDEGVTLNEWGIEGTTYTVVNDEKQFTDFVVNNPDGLDPYNALRSLGAGNTFLNRTPAEVYAALNSKGDAISFAESLQQTHVEPFPDVMPLDDEQGILDQYENDFNTYCEEMTAKFITGDEPLSNFDSFVQTLNNLGLDELLKVKQAQFDRSGVTNG